MLAAAGPMLWLGYNAVVYRNPLEFANGPYSARAINQKTATVNPAQGNWLAAGSYFVKAAELNVSEVTWLGRLWLMLALVGSFAAARQARGRVALLLWIPLPFYALSVAYGSVPIFVPSWWPFSTYNVRYGLQLLPAFAVFVPMGVAWILENVVRSWNVSARWRQWSSVGALPGVLILGAGSYAAIWHADPICYREAAVNMRGRIAIDRQLEAWFHSLPAGSTWMMYLGEHVGALEQAGIPLKRVINEGNHRVWQRPSDPEGLWERALANPRGYADYAVGFEGDEVWNAANAQHLTAIVEIHSTGQPAAVLFQAGGQVPASLKLPEAEAAPR